MIIWLDYIQTTLGYLFSWFIKEFRPAFPLVTIASLFILYEAKSTYDQNKQVHRKSSKRIKKKKTKFKYKRFKHICSTLFNENVIIFLMFCVQRWICIDVYIPLSNIAAGIIVIVHLVLITKNKVSCHRPNDNNALICLLLVKIIIIIIERHININMEDDDLTNICNN